MTIPLMLQNRIIKRFGIPTSYKIVGSDLVFTTNSNKTYFTNMDGCGYFHKYAGKITTPETWIDDSIVINGKTITRIRYRNNRIGYYSCDGLKFCNLTSAKKYAMM